VTTAGKPQAKGKIDSLGMGLGVRELYAESTNPPPTRLFTEDLGWDKKATNTDDIDSFLPINRLVEYATNGRIGSVSPRFYGVPTDYSQNRTLQRYGPQILEWCCEDRVDAVLLSALWPVCHQTVSLVARHLEENGIPTAIMGSARDIVEECGVARFVFTDFPLGNPCGIPWDNVMQRSIVGTALDLLERAWMPRTTVQTPFHWGNDTWRETFMRVDDNTREVLARAGEERRRLQVEIKADR
jgi:D-proline reductase (dithiol) PrdB